MSTYNGEPYEGFFKKVNETDEQYNERCIAANKQFQEMENAQISVRYELDNAEDGQIMQWDGDAMRAVDASWVTVAADDRVDQLEREVAALKDTLARVEAFANSMLELNANRLAAEGPPPLVISDEQATRIFDPVDIKVMEAIKAPINEATDYDRAMALVGK